MNIYDDNDDIYCGLCGGCGIAGCCSPLKCLRGTLLFYGNCKYGESYYKDLSIAWAFYNWILRNADHLLKDTSDLDQFNAEIEKEFSWELNADELANYQEIWRSELLDHGLIRKPPKSIDQEQNDPEP